MRFIQVIWQDPAWHPTVRHTAQLVCERGASVDVLCRYVREQRDFLSDANFGTRTNLTFGGTDAGGWRGRWEFFLFLIQVWRRVRASQPDCVIGYDVHGAFALLLLSYARRGTLLVYHNFDLLPTPKTARQRLVSWLVNLGARRADHVIVSSPTRAGVLQRSAALRQPPLVVPNFQRLTAGVVETGKLQARIRDRGLYFDRLVVRAGQLGPGHGIEATVRSIHGWHGQWGLILVGHPVPGYYARLQSLIEDEGLGSKVMIIPDAKPALWDDCIAAADVGIALYEPGDVNRESMAGAGNKLNIYMRAGIPSVLPDLPDFLDLLRRYPLGVPADPGRPVSIADAVNALLEDRPLHERCAGAARRAFEEEYNFEHLFGPVLDFLWRKAEERVPSIMGAKDGISAHDLGTETWLGERRME